MLGKNGLSCAAWHVQRAGARRGDALPQGNSFPGSWGGYGLPNEGRRPGPCAHSRQDHPIPTRGTDSPGEGSHLPPWCRRSDRETNACAERADSLAGLGARAHASAGGGAGPRRGPFREPRPCRSRFLQRSSGMKVLVKRVMRVKGPLKGRLLLCLHFYR